MRRGRIFEFMGVILLCLMVIGGCGGGNTNPVVSGAGTQKSDEKGNLAVNLIWNMPEGEGKFAAPSTVVNVKINVSATDISTLSQTHAASAGTGTVSDVPAGSGRTVTGYGLEGTGKATYTGTATNITVTGGQTTQVTIVLSAVASSTGLDWPHKDYDSRSSRYAAKASAAQALSGWTSVSATLSAAANYWYGLVGDVNGDNVNDIVVGASGNIFIYSGSGALQKTITIPTNHEPTTLIDINGDGVLDIGVGVRHTGGQGKVYFLSGSTGSEIWSYTRSTGGDGIGPKFMINGKLLVASYAGYALQPRGVHLITPSATTGTESWYYSMGPCSDISSATDTYIALASYTCHNGSSGNGVNGTGTTTTDSELWYYLLNYSGNEVFVKKANNTHTDGASNTYILFNGKILGTEMHDSTYYGGTSKVRLFDTSGTELVVKNRDTNEDWVHPAFDNNKIVVGGRGRLEVYSATDLTVLASKTISGGLYWSTVTLHDINGDGISEIIAASGTTVYVFDSSLNELASYQFATTDSFRAFSVADVTGDSKADFVVIESGKLSVYSSSFQMPKGAIQVSW